jgi:signal transduction histidine kinase
VRRLTIRRRRPRSTVRRRLTLLYGGLFLLGGIALLAITYVLQVRTSSVVAVQAFSSRPGSAVGPQVPPGVVGTVRLNPAANLISQQRSADLHGLAVVSLVALAIMAVMSVVLGSLIAGRVLRPLRVMTATTRQISEENLHQRLALDGPRDELRDLGDTIDGLLGRLENAFDAQRRFVANASHELRTPLTVARALLEMVLSDPDATIDTFRTTCQHVLEAGEEQEQLIDALLMLARSQRGLGHREPVDLALVTRQVLDGSAPDAANRGLHLDALLSPARVAGDPRLIERLVGNLVGNALRHNRPGGGVQVAVQTRAGRPTLQVTNSGPLVPADQIPRLLAPFQRIATERVGDGDGLGLGLSIVAAIATAHDASLDIQPMPGGGLDVTVSFPPATIDGDGALESGESGLADGDGGVEPLGPDVDGEAREGGGAS